MHMSFKDTALTKVEKMKMKRWHETPWPWNERGIVGRGRHPREVSATRTSPQKHLGSHRGKEPWAHVGNNTTQRVSNTCLQQDTAGES